MPKTVFKLLFRKNLKIKIALNHLKANFIYIYTMSEIPSHQLITEKEKIILQKYEKIRIERNKLTLNYAKRHPEIGRNNRRKYLLKHKDTELFKERKKLAQAK